LWLDDQAEQAAQFYMSIFKNSKILKTTHCEKQSAEKIGKETRGQI